MSPKPTIQALMGLIGIFAAIVLPVQLASAAPGKIVHDAEHFVLAAQHGGKWMTEDKNSTPS